MGISIQEAERRLNSGGDISAITHAQWRELEAIEARNNAAADPWGGGRPQPQQNYDPTPGPNFLGGQPSAPQQSGPSEYEKWLMEQERQRKIAEQNKVIATLKAAFSEYGLDGLYGQITKWARQDYSADAIMLELRKTNEYKNRFPAMQALSKKGRGITEAEYIAFEREATRLEREYGLPSGMLGKDSVTDLLTNEVSAKELGERVVMASNASQQVPDEMRAQFSKFYGVREGDLAAYFLDSDRAMPLLERQYAASNIAGQGLIQGVDTTQDIAEDLFEAGVTAEGAREGFGRVARDRALTQGKSNSVNQEQLTRGTFGESDYMKKINRARSAEVGQYAGGGSFVSSESGMSGLGKANN